VNSKSIDMVRAILSAEEKESRLDGLDLWVPDEEKSWKPYNDLMEDWWREANTCERMEFSEDWETEKEKVRRVFLRFLSENQSPLIFVRTIAESHSLRLADADLEAAEDEDDDDSI
jgi:hypothetical protein